jgi:hypothetical protein
MNNSIDFNCKIDARQEVIIQLPRDADDMGQDILILVVTNEGVVFDFYADGELTSTIARTYEEWNDEAQSAIASRSNHPTNWKVNKENSL